ncbi:MAG: ABC transporter permease, partial [Planctomycetota bacterium]
MAILAASLAVVGVTSGISWSIEARAGVFFGAGAAMLAALLLFVRGRLAVRRDAATKAFGEWALAARNVARAPGRSLLTVALVACASFLILAISAFRLAPSEEGTGGFVLVAQSDQPIHHDLNTPEGRIELGFRSADEELLDRFRVHALRVHDGEDASCLNLYQTRQPRVLGVPDPAAVLGRFAFGDGGAALEEDDATVPAALDFNTAMYSLKLYGGVGSRLTIRDGVDQPVDVEVAGLLKNSILQGDLLVAEQDFLELYPATGGYRFFLIEPTAADESNTLADSGELAAMLEDRLSDYGFDAEDAERRLAGFLAVQNTYLSTFQSLGALGLLLGAV